MQKHDLRADFAKAHLIGIDVRQSDVRIIHLLGILYPYPELKYVRSSVSLCPESLHILRLRIYCLKGIADIPVVYGIRILSEHRKGIRSGYLEKHRHTRKGIRIFHNVAEPVPVVGNVRCAHLFSHFRSLLRFRRKRREGQSKGIE